jgi:HlyD family secretion protein
MSARVWFIILIILTAAAGGAYYLFFLHPMAPAHAMRFSGTIEATKVDVSFQISGRVSELLVREGQPVKQGDVLARMSADELNSRVQQIQASLDSTVSQAEQQQAALVLRQNVVNNQIRQAQGQADAAQIAVERLQEGSRPQEIKVAEAAVTQAEADLERRKNDFDRLSGLLQRGAISQQEYDAVRQAYLAAQTTLTAALERLALAKEGPRKEDIAEAQARSRSAQAGVGVAKSGQKEIDMQKRAVDSARAHERELRAELDAAKTQLGYSEIKSPIDGVVLLKNIESGEVVNPGTPVVTVGDIQNLWMNIYVPETKTGMVKLEQSVFVHVDAFPSEYFSGNVSFISSESEFTPKTIQTEEERVKLVYRVKVTLVNKNQKLKPGMPADAEISPAS